MFKFKATAAVVLIFVMLSATAASAAPIDLEEMTNREIVAFVIDAILEEHSEEFDFDREMLENLTEVLYLTFTGDDVRLIDYIEPMQEYIEGLISSLYLGFEDIESITLMLSYVRLGTVISEVFGDDGHLLYFIMLHFIEEIVESIGEVPMIRALGDNPHLIYILQYHGADIIDALNFSLFDELRSYFLGNDKSPGLLLLDEVLGGLISRQSREIFAGLLHGNLSLQLAEFIELDEIENEIIDIYLDAEHLEQRMAFEFSGFFALYDVHLQLINEARLNLFFENTGDSYVVFFVYSSEHPTVSQIVAAGERITLQHLYAAPISDLVMITLISLDGSDLDGEFALRLTHQPL